MRARCVHGDGMAIGAHTCAVAEMLDGETHGHLAREPCKCSADRWSHAGEPPPMRACAVRSGHAVQTFAALSASSTRSLRNGARCRRTPVASWMALAMAAISGLWLHSPAP